MVTITDTERVGSGGVEVASQSPFKRHPLVEERGITRGLGSLLRVLLLTSAFLVRRRRVEQGLLANDDRCDSSG